MSTRPNSSSRNTKPKVTFDGTVASASTKIASGRAFSTCTAVLKDSLVRSRSGRQELSNNVTMGTLRSTINFLRTFEQTKDKLSYCPENNSDTSLPLAAPRITQRLRSANNYRKQARLFPMF